ncbi:hypothetical protein J7J81_02290 [bacterium]|nr:hypothetical protein [bacterium]
MKFIAENINENIASLAGKLGYKTTANNNGELNCIKPVYGAGCPRFHLLIKKYNNKVIFKLH